MHAVRYKLAALKAASVLRGGGIIAHHTATLPGVAASPFSQAGVARICRYKQRQGPFLLLADSMGTAAKLIRHFSPALRRAMRTSWPGAVTLIVPAKPGLNDVCYNGSQLAIRIDASFQTCQLASCCGGLLLSSSLNRKGGETLKPNLQSRYRLQRHINHRVPGIAGSGKASTILRVWRNDFTSVRA